MQYELRLSGSGGQGLILAGVILAEAALLDGKNAIQSQSYGPEARGGASKAEVIIGDSDISFVKVQNCDMLLCLTQAAYDKYGNEPVKVLIVDESVNIRSNLPERVYKLPVIASASEKLGKTLVANIVALGAVNGVLNLVSRESLVKAVLARVPKGTEQLNESALALGYELAQNT